MELQLNKYEVLRALIEYAERRTGMDFEPQDIKNANSITEVIIEVIE